MTDLPKCDPEGAPKKPQIVGIGAQKAGTTWLGQMISQHPQVWLPPFKEAQFFNHRFVPEHRQWLPWHFKRARQNQEKRYAAKGEAMPPALDAYLDRITRGEMFTNHWYKQVFAPAPEGTAPCDITPEYSTLPDEGVEFVTEFLPQARFFLDEALDHWILGSEPFIARLNPDAPGYATYDQLMRLDEWAGREE